MKNTVGFADNSLNPVSFNRVPTILRYGNADFYNVFFTGVFKHVNRYILAGKAPALAICTCEQVIFL